MRSSALVLLLASLSFAAHAAGELEPAPRPAGMQAGPPGHWSIISGETVSPGRDAISAAFGFPGVTLGYWHGFSDNSDVGLNFDLLYSYEGTSANKLGLGLGVPFRLMVLRRDKLGLQLHIDPGMRVYTGKGSTDFLLRFPIGATIGVQVLPELRLAVGVDLPMAIHATTPAYFAIGPQFGFALEYYVDKQLNLGLDTRFGPQFYSVGGDSDFVFRTQVTLGYRLQ